MTKLTATRGAAAVNAVALSVLLGACSDGHDGQARAAEAIVVAHADTGPTIETLMPPIETAEVVRVRPVNVTYGEAESAFRKGRYVESMELFDVYVEENPTNEFGHYLLGLSAWKSGEHERAETALTRAVELNGESVKVRTNLGRVLLERGRATDALPHIEKAIDLAPTSHEVWRVLGNAQAQLGSTDDAIDSYQQALMLNDRDAWTMNNYGLLLIRLGMFEDALPPLARAVELVPGSATFQNNLGVALERVGELEGARRAFTAAVEADSTYTKAQISLDRVQARLDETPMDPPDLTVYSQRFVEEMKQWVSEEEHGC